MTDTTQQTASTDLMSLLNPEVKEEATAKVPLVFDGLGDPVSGLIIVGKNSPQARNAARSVQVATVMRSNNRKSALDASTETGAEALIDTVELNNSAMALAVTVGWYGFAMNGADAVFDPEAVAAMFKKFPTWQEKVLRTLEAEANFLKV